MTPEGEVVESSLPKHGTPTYTTASYESLKLCRWSLGTAGFRSAASFRNQYERSRLRVISKGFALFLPGSRNKSRPHALTVALMVSLASLLCGAVLYPVVVHLSADNERKAREVLDSHISMMEALGRAIAKRDSDTGVHNYRVAWIAARIAERMGLSGSDMQALIAGSFLHDVGKIGVPDAVLLKPGKLDDAELVVMRTHVGQGEEIVTGMGWLDGAQAVVAGHHEKWNGSGYPRGLAGEDDPAGSADFCCRRCVRRTVLETSIQGTHAV